jgi:hypothetical protein
MPSKWIFFKIVLCFNLCLSVAAFGLLVFLLNKFPQLKLLSPEKIFFFISYIVFGCFSLAGLWVLRTKFPSGEITNSAQGIAYSLGILAFIACAFFIFYDLAVASTIIKYVRQPNVVIILLTIVLASSALLAIVNVYLGISIFQLLKMIAGNRAVALKGIQELGSS